MKPKLIIFIVASFLSMMLLGLSFEPASPPAKTVDLKVIKVDNVWKVVDATDYSKTTVKVKKNDKITWTVVGTDASFQFPEELLDPVETSDSLQNGYTKFVRDGKKLKLKIKNSAKAGTYEYSVYCTADSTFAIGGSPPKIIVE
jgi:hypothetical protein